MENIEIKKQEKSLEKLFAPLVLIVFFLVGFFLVNHLSEGSKFEDFGNIKYIKIAEQNIKVDLALTSVARERGLGGRSELAGDSGMLFVFSRPGKYPFWMKDMNFAIDIIWINKDFKVVYIKKNALPESYPERFLPGKDAKYVLEVSSGFSEKNNLRVGDGALFTY